MNSKYCVTATYSIQKNTFIYKYIGIYWYIYIIYIKFIYHPDTQTRCRSKYRIYAQVII